VTSPKSLTCVEGVTSVTHFVLRIKPCFDRMSKDLLVEEADALFYEAEEIRSALVEAQEIGATWQAEALRLRELVNRFDLTDSDLIYFPENPHE
jgi:hypothetical protein